MEHAKAKITPSAEMIGLIKEISTPLEVALNILYLMRICGPNSELHERLLPVAEDKLQEIVQIMKHCH